MADQANTPRAKGFNVVADLRDDGNTLLIVVDLTGESRPSATGKSDLFGTSGGIVQIEHPEHPGLWYSVSVGQMSSEYAEAKAEVKAARERLKAFRAKGAPSIPE